MTSTGTLRFKSKDLELYDHQIDPHEIKNLAKENPEVTEKLLEIYNQNTQLK